MIKAINTGVRYIEEIENEDIQGNVALIKNLTNENFTIIQAKNTFKSLHNEKILCSGFEDDCWIFPSKYNDKSTYIHFDLLKKFKIPLKKYCVIRTNAGIDCESFCPRIITLIDVLLLTNFFDEKLFFDIKEDLIEEIKHPTEVTEILMFMDFMQINNVKYRDCFRSLKFEENSRTLPNFDSILKFDEIIKQYKNLEINENLFDIIILWWELTKIIPIRPIEFFTLNKNCLIKENDKYYIKINRAKRKYNSSREVIPILDKIRINEYLYTLFYDFKQKYRNYLIDDYLFNTTLYTNLYKTMNKGTFRVKRNGFIGRGEMYNIFNLFYENVVQNTFHYKIVEKQGLKNIDSNEIEKIQYGDTRHIAFINLLLQNVSPYLIAQIGGHSTLNQQLSYYNHIEPYLSSKAYLLSHDILNSFKQMGYDFEVYKKEKSSSIDKIINKNKINDNHKIEIGYCLSNNVPFDCIPDDCIYCKHCIIDTTKNDCLIREKNNIKATINMKANYLKKIISNGIKVVDGQNELQTTINELNAETQKLSIINAKETLQKEIDYECK